jgi:3-hydroxyacyl-[acyl-carrier-protein] dehydratase
MKLINDFFNIVDAKTEEGVYRCKVKLNADHALYKVHFPGNPITPACVLCRLHQRLFHRSMAKTCWCARQEA